jgi:DNA-binding transcriptional LysR family regulator
MAFYGSRVYLARRGKPEGPNDLIKHDLVGWDAAVTHAKALLWANERGHRVVVRVNDAAVMADAVAAGVGLAALPCILGDERDGLVRLDALGLAADDIYAVAPGELRRSARVRAVIDLLSEVWAANRDRLSGKSR